VNRKSYQILIGKPGSTKLLERHHFDRMILNFVFKQWDMKVSLDDEGFNSGPNFLNIKGNEVK
jgi:hypothetical protein